MRIPAPCAAGKGAGWGLCGVNVKCQRQGQREDTAEASAFQLVYCNTLGAAAGPEWPLCEAINHFPALSQ